MAYLLLCVFDTFSIQPAGIGGGSFNEGGGGGCIIAGMLRPETRWCARIYNNSGAPCVSMRGLFRAQCNLSV